MISREMNGRTRLCETLAFGCLHGGRLGRFSSRIRIHHGGPEDAAGCSTTPPAIPRNSHVPKQCLAAGTFILFTLFIFLSIQSLKFAIMPCTLFNTTLNQTDQSPCLRPTLPRMISLFQQRQKSCHSESTNLLFFLFFLLLFSSGSSSRCSTRTSSSPSSTTTTSGRHGRKL